MKQLPEPPELIEPNTPGWEVPDCEGWGEAFNITCGWCGHLGMYHKYSPGGIYTIATYCLVKDCMSFTGEPEGCQGFSSELQEKIKERLGDQFRAGRQTCIDYEEIHKKKWFW